MSFFIYRPDTTPIYYDPEEAFLEFQRREYVKRLHEQQQRTQFERELQLEEARHRAALTEIKQKEQQRRQRMSQLQAQLAARAEADAANWRYARQPQQAYSQPYARQERMYAPEESRPTPREILARRLARQHEEEMRSRQFHQNILSHIFGVPMEEFDQPMDEEYEEEEEPETEAEEVPRQPTLAQLVNQLRRRQTLPEQPAPIRKPSLRQPADSSLAAEPVPVSASTAVPEEKMVPTTEDVTMDVLTDEPLPEPEPEPHWSSAPQRARALAEISAIDRAFNSLKSTFVFPSGSLERLPGSDAPRLAYNPTNAVIHAYEHALSELLPKLDSIESYGFKGVREARKQLVVKIERELEDLDGRVIERLTGSAITTMAPISSLDSESMDASTLTYVLEEKEVPAIAFDALPANPVDAMTIPTPALQLDSNQASVRATPVPSEQAEVTTITTTADAPSQPKLDLPEVPTTTSSTIPPTDTAKIVEQESKTTVLAETTPSTSGEPKVEPTAPATIALAASIPLPETMSDEELEIEDAIHIETTGDESDTKNKGVKEHQSAVGEFEML